MQKMLLADSENGEWKEKDEDEYRNREDGVKRDENAKEEQHGKNKRRKKGKPTNGSFRFVRTLDD